MRAKYFFLFLSFSIFFFQANAQGTAGKTTFTEGIVRGKVTTPGNMLGEVMGKIDFSKPNVQEQIEAIIGKMTEEEMDRYQTDMQKAGMLVLALNSMPMKFSIWTKGQRAAARYHAMNYYGETAADLMKKEGMMFMQSSRNEENITLKYTGDQMQQMGKQVLSNEDYDIVRTKETALVAGFPCVKSVYTLKGATEAAVLPGDEKAYRVEVWTSPLISKTLNFLHPLYVEEEQGITKLLVTFDKSASLKLQYEFVAVESKAVTEQDLSIRKSSEVHDAGNQQVMLGLVQKIMAITMGISE